jgi:bifunctional DNA-binding transcriptional regulator/antitoxin component of YhaV-PrlF toxin-antitoxin module
MGYPTKVQLIRRKKTADQYYINFPTALAEAMDFKKGEIIEWIVEDKANIIAHRREVPASPVVLKKELRRSVPD